MAHKYKVGDRVILGANKNGQPWTDDMDRYVGRVATLKNECGYDAWIVDVCVWYWQAANLTLVGCSCRIKNCLTHRLVKNSPATPRDRS